MLRFGSKQSLQKQSLSAWFIGPVCGAVFGKMSVSYLSGHLSACLSPDIYVLDIFGF